MNSPIIARIPIIDRDLIGLGLITDRVPITVRDGPITDHVPITDLKMF